MNNPRFKDCISCNRKNVYCFLNGKCKICSSPSPAHRTERNIRIAEDYKVLTCEEVARKYKMTPQRVHQLIKTITGRLGLSSRNIKIAKAKRGYKKAGITKRAKRVKASLDH